MTLPKELSCAACGKNTGAIHRVSPIGADFIGKCADCLGAKSSHGNAAILEAIDGIGITTPADCISCWEKMPVDECPNSKRPCGHHCDCSWIHDYCHWCGAEFGEEQPHD